MTAASDIKQSWTLTHQQMWVILTPQLIPDLLLNNRPQMSLGLPLSQLWLFSWDQHRVSLSIPRYHHTAGEGQLAWWGRKEREQQLPFLPAISAGGCYYTKQSKHSQAQCQLYVLCNITSDVTSATHHLTYWQLWPIGSKKEWSVSDAKASEMQLWWNCLLKE